MDGNQQSSTQEVLVLEKQVQELSINGDEPPPRFIRRDKDDVPINTSLSSSIPIIDLHVLSSPSSSSEEKDNEMEKLKLALSTWGFFQAIGHNIPSSLLDEMQRKANDFFDLPMEEKKKYSINYDGKQDYLQGYGNDLVVSEDQLIDWSDRLYLLIKPLDQREYKHWPDNPNGFRKIINEYSMKTHLVAEIVLKYMAKSLGLEENYFHSAVQENAPTFLRFNYYPPCSRPDLVYGVKPHADGGAITILLQDKEVEGLQILKDGNWIKVPIVPHALLVNVADQVEIMSNGVFRSVVHRVITNTEKPRFSLAMFYVPEKEIDIEPAKDLITESKPRLFKKMKSEEYGELYFQSSSRGMRGIDNARV
ncbi:hypothetical protein IFM89_033179 [Coptis chinensis]|uniref:Fe2OG dioxygenase domain-containing protein n=1 Tax=Coptis chinensis TaxID=261450 RepID=A0A835IHD7_9MAGN|nr:hypothetical protein IFM89_033179 [Coptis chinensis]